MNGWRPISTAPKHGPILVWCDFLGLAIAHRDENFGWVLDNPGDPELVELAPSFWMDVKTPYDGRPELSVEFVGRA